MHMFFFMLYHVFHVFQVEPWCFLVDCTHRRSEVESAGEAHRDGLVGSCRAALTSEILSLAQTISHQNVPPQDTSFGSDSTVNIFFTMDTFNNIYIYYWGTTNTSSSPKG